MKIGIMAAMPDEINTIHDEIHFDRTEHHAQREFHLGSYDNIDLVLVIAKVGKVAASITTTVLIERYKVDYIIFTGLAGAVAPSLNRGDIVLATGSYQHDFDARPLCPEQFEIPLLNQKLFTSQPNDLALAEQAIQQFLSKIDHYVDHAERIRLEATQPKLVKGIIATGDDFIEDIDQQDNLVIDTIQATAIEMEGAAVAQVCAEYNLPYLLIRTISDKANESAHVSLLDFSQKIASHYASGIVQELLLLLRKNN